MLFRSSANSQIDSVKKLIETRSTGHQTQLLARFSPWEPNFDGKLVKAASSTYTKLFGKAPLVRTTHGGLESAIFAERLPGTQIISFGPTIHNAHSPDESIEISSVQKFWKLLLALIAK
jgi:dipeptidase D